jgi:hypothetical protein
MDHWWQVSAWLTFAGVAAFRLASGGCARPDDKTQLVLRPIWINRVGMDWLTAFWFVGWCALFRDLGQNDSAGHRLLFGVFFPIMTVGAAVEAFRGRTTYGVATVEGIGYRSAWSGWTRLRWDEIERVEMASPGAEVRVHGTASRSITFPDSWEGLEELVRLCQGRVPVKGLEWERFTPEALAALNGLTASPKPRSHRPLATQFPPAWADEVPPDDAPGWDRLRTWSLFEDLLIYRRSLIEGGEQVEYRPLWEQVCALAPNWPGLRPERRGPMAMKQLRAVTRYNERVFRFERRLIPRMLVLYGLCTVVPFLATDLAAEQCGRWGPAGVTAGCTLVWCATLGRRSIPLVASPLLIITMARVLLALG